MRDIEDVFSLTPVQEGMLFHYLSYPKSEAYFEQLELLISGKIEREVFKRAWDFVVRSNEILRATFRWERVNKPVQVILREYLPTIKYYDLSSPSRERSINKEGSCVSPENGGSLEGVKEANRHEGFDLQHVPFRVTLCNLKRDRYVMIVSYHHILCDGWSSGIIVKEFLQAYEALSRQEEPKKHKKRKFKHFVKFLQSLEKTNSESFWKAYLEGVDSGSDRSAGTERVKEVKDTGNHRFGFEGEKQERLDRYLKEHRLTLAALIYCTWGILIQRYNNRRDVIFDTTVSGRSQRFKGSEDMVGLFINILPLRLTSCPGEPIADCLKRVNEHTQKREIHDAVSTGVINEYLAGFRENYLFDSVVVIENYPLDRRLLERQGMLTIDSYSIIERTRYDLTVLVKPLDAIEVDITYNRCLFSEKSVSDLSHHFLSIVEEILDDPAEEMDHIAVWNDAERAQIVSTLNNLRCNTLTVEPASEYTAPRNDREKRLVEIWADLFRVDKSTVSIDTNFFDFGGHSLKASFLSARVQREFDVKIPLGEIFRNSNIRKLADYIKGKTKKKQATIKPVEKKEYYAVSSAQQRFYMLQKLEPANTAYNMTVVMRVEGRLDTVGLETMFNTLVNRHEILHTSFFHVGGKPVQKIDNEVAFRIEYNESTEHPSPPGVIAENFVRPFDLSKAPLLRVSLVKVGHYDHILVMDMHHIISDGISMDLFIREFNALYSGKRLPQVNIEYKDFCEWKDRRLSGGDLKMEEEFWLRRFTDNVPALNILTDFPRPSMQTFTGDRLFFNLDTKWTDRLHEMIRPREVTLYMLLSAVLNILLFRYTGQEDVSIGTTTAGRDKGELEDIIGLFIETTVMRHFPHGFKSFSQFLQEVKKDTLIVFEHSEYPFGELLKKLGERGVSDLSSNPLFKVMLIVQNVDLADIDIEGLTFKPVNYYPKKSKVDLTLEATEQEGEIRFHIEYCSDLYRRETMERFSIHFINILKEVIEQPETLLSDIKMIDAKEERKIRQEFSRSNEKYSFWKDETGPGDRVDEHFSRQALQSPEHMAVRYEEGETIRNFQITYSELYRQVEELSQKIEEL